MQKCSTPLPDWAWQHVTVSFTKQALTLILDSNLLFRFKDTTHETNLTINLDKNFMLIWLEPTN
jgi:hypothetical protein